MYEVYSISGHYVLHDGTKSLWCSKIDGGIVPSNSTVLDEFLEPVCLGTCHGIVGKLKFLPDSPENLVLIAEREFVCLLHGHKVYKIRDIVMLPLSLETPYLDLPACPLHSKPPKGEDVTETDAKIERKLEKEYKEWFEKSFYYSETGDITHTLTEMTSPDYVTSAAVWQRAKKEYFWNEHMLECLIAATAQLPDICDPWILPVMQGYIEGQVVASLSPVPARSSSSSRQTAFMTVVSRRSKHRAGTRFKRRGIDDDGHPANYVVSEQILSVGQEQLSYTIVRGSVPVYWYQPLTNYRPKPLILRTPEEALSAFRIHMDELIDLHKKVVVVNLLDNEGKEAPLGHEYAKIAYMYNNENLVYIAFDFNEYCAGMRFDNVSLLLKELDKITNKFGHTHVIDGVIKTRQEGVVRVNCMDSLDRTNVVQGAIARHCLEHQASILRIPLESLSDPGKLLWANNGDAISTQYAGTAALKGDYTRTGERGVAGMMRDGVSSVTRMYINLFRDTNRQAAIDIMQGLEPDLADVRDEQKEELYCIPELMELGRELLPSPDDSSDQKSYKSWICQEWPNGTAAAICLTPQLLTVVHSLDNIDNLLLSTCDRIHIGQPPDCSGHYMRIINGKTSLTVRPLTLDISQLKDTLMKMAHSIVSCRDEMGLSTQVLHGPLGGKADLVDMGIDKLKISANTFGIKIAAGAKRMMGEARGVLDNTRSGDSTGNTSGDSAITESPRDSPKFGKRVLNMFRRDNEVSISPPVRLSELRRGTQDPTRPPLHNTQHPDPTRPPLHNTQHQHLEDQELSRDRVRGINHEENSVSQDTYPAHPNDMVDEPRSCHLPVIDGDASPSGRGPQHVQIDGSPARARSDTDITRLEPATALRRTFKDRSATFDSIETSEDSKSMFIFFDKVESTSDLELYNTPSSNS